MTPYLGIKFPDVTSHFSEIKKIDFDHLFKAQEALKAKLDIKEFS